MLCIAIYVRKILGFKGKIAAISPCIAKIDEFRETGVIDYNVTMEHLKKYFEKIRLTYQKLKFIVSLNLMSIRGWKGLFILSQAD